MFDMLAAHPLTYAVGLALVHFLWQGVVIAGGAAWLFYCLRRTSAVARYTVGCVALLTMAAAPIITTVRVLDEPAPTAERVDTPGMNGPGARLDGISPAPLEPSHDAAASTRRPTMLAELLPAVVLLWAGGVLVLTINLTAAWIRARRVRRAASPVPDPWRRQLDTLVERLGLGRIAFSESAAIGVPTLIGWLRPAILVPGSVLTGLTPPQLDAILTHELAHVRRHDYLVNVVQSVIETLLFYHPGVWWVSRRVRIERERCCDDVVVTICHDRVVYARALASLEELRGRQPALGIAATGGQLLDRVRRILSPEPMDEARSSAWTVLAVATAIAPAVLFGVAVQSSPAADQRRAPVESATIDHPAISPPRIEMAAPAPPAVVRVPDRVPPEPASAPVETAAQVQPPAGATKDQAAVLALEEQFRLAKVKNDIPALDRLLDDAVISTNQSGVKRNKTELIDLWRTFRVELLTLDAADVEVQGDLATVTGRQTEVSGTSDYPMLFTRIWRRVQGDWRLFSVTQFRDPNPPTVQAAHTQSAARTTRTFLVEYELYRNDALLGRPTARATAESTWLIPIPGERAVLATAQAVEGDALRLSLVLPGAGNAPPSSVMLRGEEPVEISWTSGTRTYRLRFRFASGGATQPVAVGAGMSRPAKIRDVPPVYPAEAKAAKVAGMVIIETVVDENGDVADARIIRSVPMLDQAALDAVRQWKYAPTLLNGKPVAVVMTVNVTFAMQ
jgi:TonB family protein